MPPPSPNDAHIILRARKLNFTIYQFWTVRKCSRQKRRENSTMFTMTYHRRRHSIVQSWCFFSPIEIRSFILWFSFRFDFVWNIKSISRCFVQSFWSLLPIFIAVSVTLYRNIIAPLKVCLFWDIWRNTSFDGILRFEVKKSYAVIACAWCVDHNPYGFNIDAYSAHIASTEHITPASISSSPLVGFRGRFFMAQRFFRSIKISILWLLKIIWGCKI